MGRTVVVTGGARGIGAAIVTAFTELGDDIVALDLIDAEQPVDGVRYRRCDVSDPDAVDAAFGGPGEIDVLVNNAGIARQGLVGVQPAQEWQAIIAVNLTGTFLCCSAVVPRMRPGGSIVSIGSTAAFVGLAGRAAYGATKAGVLSLTRVLAVELAPKGIRANAVCPGFTRTAIIAQGISDAAPTTRRRCSNESRPAGRPAGRDRGRRAGGVLPGRRGRVLHHRPVAAGRRRMDDPGHEPGPGLAHPRLMVDYSSPGGRL